MKPSPVDVEGVSATSPRGQAAVVTAAFEQYHAELYSYLRRSTRDEGAAEDLMQESFLRLFKEVEAGRTPDNMRAWLYRVGSNLAISRGRRATTVLDWMSRYGRSAGRPSSRPSRTSSAGSGPRHSTRSWPTSPRTTGRRCCSPRRASAARRSPRRSGGATAPRGRCCAAPGSGSGSSSSGRGTSDDVDPRRDPRAGGGRHRLRAEPGRARDALPVTCANARRARVASRGCRPTSGRSPDCRATR